MQTLFELELVVRDGLITSANGDCRENVDLEWEANLADSRLNKGKRENTACAIFVHVPSILSVNSFYKYRCVPCRSECLITGTMCRRDCEYDLDAESRSGR